MKSLKFLAGSVLFVLAAAAHAECVISEADGAQNAAASSAAAVQAPLAKTEQVKAITPQDWQRVFSAMPKANLMNGFAVHSKQFCASCHGKEGLSNTPNWPDVAGQPYAVTVKALLDFREGRRKGTHAADLMTAAAAGLTDQQIVDVAALYAHLPGRGAQSKPAAIPEPSLVKSGDPARYITPCAACHGVSSSGNSNGQVPVIHGQQADSIVASLKDYRSGARQSDMLGEMRVFSRSLTDAEIEKLARWYAAQPGRPAVEMKLESKP